MKYLNSFLVESGVRPYAKSRFEATKPGVEPSTMGYGLVESDPLKIMNSAISL